MANTDLHYLELLEVGRQIQSRARSSVEVTRAMLARIEVLNPRLLSYVTLMADSALADAQRADQEIAAGKSHILCPALMAQKLYGQLPERQRKLNKWCPGKSFGLGRSLSEADIAASRLRLRLANEILKLIPAQGDAIVRQSVLSVQGAKFLGWLC